MIDINTLVTDALTELGSCEPVERQVSNESYADTFLAAPAGQIFEAFL